LTSRALGIAAASLVCLAALACSGDQTVPAATWGGHNAELVVTSSGATAQFKCGATGSIDMPLMLRDSTFDEAGTYTPHVINTGTQAARYSGSVSGSTMTLDVSVGGQPVGTFDLTMGTAATFDVCNF
jgi:hypothetical protein